MASATQNISIRIAVIDGDKVRRELTLTGDAGQRALARIRDATAPAGKSLAAVNVAGEQLRHGLENLAGGSGSLGASLIRLGPAGLAAGAAIGALGFAVSGGLREFKEAEQALNQLNAALQATDFSSGVTAQEITKLGEAVEGNTLFKKEAIQQAAASLTSFQNVAGETFTRALKLSADLAARLGTDVPAAADMLGKALEAPEEGLGRLARKFSDLSPAQKEVIGNFVRQGEVAAAQAVILEHLEAKTRGLAEAQAKGLTGAADSLSDAWDDLLESFGRTVSESGAAQASLGLLTRAVRGLQEAVDPTRAQRKSRLEAEISALQVDRGARPAPGGARRLAEKSASCSSLTKRSKRNKRKPMRIFRPHAAPPKKPPPCFAIISCWNCRRNISRNMRRSPLPHSRKSCATPRNAASKYSHSTKATPIAKPVARRWRRSTPAPGQSSRRVIKQLQR